MQVSRTTLLVAIACLESADIGKTSPTELSNGVKVNVAQLTKAVKLLSEAEPSICNDIKAERVGYIEMNDQRGEQFLVLQVGILGEKYKIDRKGDLVKESGYEL